MLFVIRGRLVTNVFVGCQAELYIALIRWDWVSARTADASYHRFHASRLPRAAHSVFLAFGNAEKYAELVPVSVRKTFVIPRYRHLVP